MTTSRLNAAIMSSATTAHFFKDGHYLEFDFDTDRVTRTGVPGKHDWRRLPGGLDAAVNHRNGRRYFFKGNRYYRTEVNGRSVSSRRIGVDGWHGLPDNIDAALAHPTKPKLYFFKGDRYWRWDLDLDAVDRADQRIGIDGWKGVPAGLDCAVVHPVNGKAYFFKDTTYHRFDFDADEVDRVREIGVDGWIGLDQWPTMVELSVASEDRRAMIVDRWGGDTGSPRPVVYYFHGNGGDAYDSYRRRQFHQLWPEAIVVYAEGTDVNSSGRADYNNDLAWQIRFPYKFRLGYTKDIEYVMALTREIGQRYHVDPSRSFAAGHSSGGFFSLSMMELVPHLFAGFAVLGCHARYKVEVNKPDRMLGNRAQPLALDPDDRATRARPVLYMFGHDDTSVGRDWPSSMPWWTSDPSDETQKTMFTLRQLFIRNGCGRPPITPGIWNTADKIHAHLADQYGAPVKWVMYKGDHSWPDKANQWAIDHFKDIAGH